MVKKKFITSLDYFTGGVPACAIFSMNSNAIRLILNSRRRSSSFNTSKTELSLIGLVAYFEAYFKDHFASLINIYPKLLFNLKEKNYDVNIDICDLLELESVSAYQFYGFIIAERYDFGTPTKINSLYQALLNITPFSNNEKEEYERILNDRNLLVHHGGIYTVKYVKQKMKKTSFSERVFMDSIVLSNKEVISIINYCDNIVKKVSKTTQNRIKEIIKKDKVRKNKLLQGAIDLLAME